MYVLEDFVTKLTSFVSIYTDKKIALKLPTTKQNINGHIRFYITGTQNLMDLAEKIKKQFCIIDCCSNTHGHILIWMKKDLWMSSIINEILTKGSNYGSNNSYEGTVLTLDCEEAKDFTTNMRIRLLKSSVQKLAEVNGCIMGSNGQKLLISKNMKRKNMNVILCGNVIYNNENDYIQLRKDAIAKMSASRIESGEYPDKIISKLCNISIVYEMLSVRHNKVINTTCGILNKDNGIFIMYNYSRLYQIWTTFEKKVAENYYNPLPDFKTVDFKVLKSYEEWVLVHNFLSNYPIIIQESSKYMLSGNVNIHKLCKFLLEMSSAVSLFYHRNHVLLDPLPNLLRIMYARLHLINAIVCVYENAFNLIGVEYVREM
ncbi:DALR anticodon-binding domain-containing protein 3-like [Daktulosphaira vitifoliae]|uniref:DALR anticodon-binding domain-containing protein 3-like n=1 Tax=Daktulosphaira vitifoliae TaxID=58002 RepID=UPI0021A9EEB2|nr:DALR anticodon-binding domain-containing protein 3-like [Daktulosphaira vitifoliae]